MGKGMGKESRVIEINGPTKEESEKLIKEFTERAEKLRKFFETCNAILERNPYATKH